MGTSCAEHDRPMQKSFFHSFSKFSWIFAAEISAAEDLAIVIIMVYYLLHLMTTLCLLLVCNWELSQYKIFH